MVQNGCVIGFKAMTANSFISETKLPPQMTVIHANIVPKWRLNFTDNYIVADNNKVYNTKTNKLLQMQLKGYTKGYYLHGKFYSLNVLRKHLVKIEKIKCPF